MVVAVLRAWSSNSASVCTAGPGSNSSVMCDAKAGWAAMRRESFMAATAMRQSASVAK